MMLDKLIENIEGRVEKPITIEAYRRWQASGVTRRMMEELELRLIECLMMDANTNDNDMMVRDAVRRQTTKDNVEAVLNWKPEELLSDED